MILFNEEFYLNKAQKDYLLHRKNIKNYTLKFDEKTKSQIKQFEQQIKKSSFHITKYRNIKDGLVKVGRPGQVSISTEKLLYKRPEILEIEKHWNEARDFASSIGLELDSFFLKHYSYCLKKSSHLLPTLKVLHYLIAHKGSFDRLFPRQIPHGQSTKLIGKEALLLKLFSHFFSPDCLKWEDFYHYFGLQSHCPVFQFFAPFATYDEQVVLSNFDGLFYFKSAPKWTFPGLRGTLIVENQESFYALRERLKSHLLILGSGNAISGGDFLTKVLPAPIYYWGDIDKEGMEIFSYVYDLFKEVTPIGMDLQTINRFSSLIQRVEVNTTPIRKPIHRINDSYDFVCREKIRIEQEQIPLDYILSSLP